MANSKQVFEKLYSSEELCDLERDISEAFDERFNPVMKDIPVDEHGFNTGTFKVTVEWLPE